MVDSDFRPDLWIEIRPGDWLRRTEPLALSSSSESTNIDEAEASRLRELARRRHEAGLDRDDDELALALCDKSNGDEAERSRKRELNRRRQEAGLAAV